MVVMATIAMMRKIVLIVLQGYIYLQVKGDNIKYDILIAV